MNNYSTGLLIGTLALLTANVLLVEADNSSSSDGSPLKDLLAARDFRIVVRLRTMLKGSSDFDRELQLHELYSNVENRAKILMIPINENRPQQMIGFHHDGQQLLRTEGEKGKLPSCQTCENAEFMKQIFGQVAERTSLGTGLLKKRAEIPDHLIGLGRLLFIVSACRKDMVETSSGVRIRNHAAYKYTHMIALDPDEPDKKSKLTVAYFIGRNEQLDGFNLPLRIWMQMENSDQFFVDFTFAEEIYKFDYERRDGFDLFNFPLGVGCSEKLRATNLFGVEQSIAQKVFSFRAQLIDHSTGLYGPVQRGDYFVAFDGQLNAMRSDLVPGQHAELADRDYLISVYDFVADRKYNIKQRAQEGDRRGLQAGVDCVAGRLLNRENADENTYAEPVLEVSKMVEMGSATVRGVRTRVFEQQTKKLPYFLFPHVNFMGEGGQRRSMYLPSLMNVLSKNQALSVLYFFSVTEETGSVGRKVGSLMRVDIMLRRQVMYRAEITEFAWQLVDAPNGDRQFELFSLYDRCSIGNEGPYNLVQMAMELEYSGLALRSLEDIKGSLASHTARNMALVRAISRKSSLRATQIYDVDSRVGLISSGQKLQIKASAKLSKQPEVLFEAVSVGSGIVTAATPSNSIPTFDQCFWEAARRRSGGDLLFSFCLARCWIDESPQMSSTREAKQVVTGSSLFQLSTASLNFYLPCQVFQFNVTRSDAESEKKLEGYWNKAHGSLLGGELELLLTDGFDTDQSNESQIKFECRQLHLTSQYDGIVRRISPDGEPSRALDDPVLTGLGLSPDFSKEVKVPEDQNQLGPAMSPGFCHSKCIADLSCHSYSVCVSGANIECHISESDFSEPKLLDQVKTQLAEFRKQRSKRGSIQVSFEAAPASTFIDNEPDDHDDEKQPGLIELRVDSRCRIYNKHAIDMFQRAAGTVFAKVRTKSLKAVADEEECAQLCLRKNIKFFRRAARWKLELFGEKSWADQDYQNKSVEQLRDNMRYWCATFKYLDLSSLSKQKKQMLANEEHLDKPGACLMARAQWAPKGEADAKTGTSNATDSGRSFKAKLPLYEFVYSALYERQYGVQLLHNLAGVPEKPDSVAVLRNDQLVRFSEDVESCARECFAQTVDLKPWCKSFDYVERPSRLRDRIQTYCVFNSVSLADVRELSETPDQLVSRDQSGSAGDHVWHFEPRDSYTLDSKVWSKLGRERRVALGGEPTRLHGLGIMTVLLLGLLTGLGTGVLLGKGLGKETDGRRESVANPSRSFLSGLVESNVPHQRFEPDGLELPDIENEAVSNE